jgi:photosystem II stability/assembly factor-like uncharacterized protein
MKKLFLIFLFTCFSFTILKSQWEPCNNGMPGGIVYCIAISGNNIFIGTAHCGVFLSTDNGNTWTNKYPSLSHTSAINSLAISDNNIFAGTDDGVLLSTDNGDSWTDKNSGLPLNPPIYSLAISRNNIFTGTYGGGVFLSTDNGNSWTKKS